MQWLCLFERPLERVPVRPIVAGLAAAGGLAILLAGERCRPLRPARRRLADETRNLVLGVLRSSVVQTIDKPFREALARQAVGREHGLVQKLRAPWWVRYTASFLLLDYSMNLRHVLTPKVPLLWRLHLAYHVDLKLTATTVLRFHMADMLVSLLWRAPQVRCIGPSLRALAAWESFFFASVLFHHSNLRPPRRPEAQLELVLTTPRMHGIHHQAERSCANPNWSGGINWWDRLHGTYRMEVPPAGVPIGVPAGIARFRIEDLIRLPLAKQQDAWGTGVQA